MKLLFVYFSFVVRMSEKIVSFSPLSEGQCPYSEEGASAVLTHVSAG